MSCFTLVNPYSTAPYNVTGVPRQGVKAALPNTQKQTQGGCQLEETKKYSSGERIDQNSRKRLREMEISNLSDAEFKTLVIRVLRDLTEYGKHIR